MAADTVNWLLAASCQAGDGSSSGRYWVLAMPEGDPLPASVTLTSVLYHPSLPAGVVVALAVGTLLSMFT